MYRILPLLLLIVLWSCSEDNEDKINPAFEGDVVLSTQQEVDDFADQGITEISGDLTIESELDASIAITSLEGLSNLVRVDGDVLIQRNNRLSDL